MSRELRVVIFDHPLSHAGAWVKVVPANDRTTAGEAVASAGLHADHLVMLRDGRAVECGDVVGAGGELHVAPAFGWTVAALIAIAVISAALTAYLTVQALKEFPPLPGSDDPAEKRYGFSRVSSNAQIGDVVPVVFGERERYGGKVVARIPVEDTNGTGNERVKLLICMGRGPVEQLANQTADADSVRAADLVDLDLNDTPASSFTQVRAWFRMGTQDQQPIPGFLEAEQFVQVGAGGFDLRNTSGARRTDVDPSGEVAEFTTTSPIESFVVRVRFPQGLYEISANNQVNVRTAEYRVRFRIDGDLSGYGDWVRFEVTQDRQSPFYSSPRFDVSPSGSPVTVTIQVERVSTEPADATAIDTMRWDSLLQISRAKSNFAGFAMVALEIEAGEQIQSVPRVSMRIKGYSKCLVHDGISSPASPTFVEQYSENPWYCALTYLVNSVFGMGAQVDLGRVFTDKLIEYADVADDLVDRVNGEGQRSRYTCSLVIDRDADQLEHVQRLLSVARGRIIPIGRQWSFTYDGPQNVDVETFGDGSIAVDDNGVARITYNVELGIGGYVRPNRVEGGFENAGAEGRPDSVAYPIRGQLWLATEAENAETVALDGISDVDQAASQVKYLCKRQRFRVQSVELVTSRPAVVVQPGERFGVATSLLAFGDASGRLLSTSSGDRVRLDRSVVIGSGAHVVRVMFIDGTTETVTVQSPPGEYARGSEIVVSPALSSVPLPGSEYVLGDEGVEVKPFVCTGVSPIREGESLLWQISGLEYLADVYDDTADDVESPTYSQLPSPTKPPGPLLSLTVFERTNPVSGVLEAHLSYEQSLDDASITGSFRVHWRRLGTATWALIPTASVAFRAAIVELQDADRAYEFVVVAVSVGGAFLPPSDPRHPIASLVLGFSDPPPPAPTNGAAAWNGQSYTLTWDAAEDAVAYVVLIGSDGGDDVKNGGVDTYVLTRVTLTQVDGLKLAPSQSHKFYVRSVGENGRMSFDALEIDVASASRPFGSSIIDTTTHDLSGGTDINTVHNSVNGELELVNQDAEGIWTSPEIDLGAVYDGSIYVRLLTRNKTIDPVISNFSSMLVPTIESDQWGVINDDKDVGMLWQPYADDTLAYSVEVRWGVSSGFYGSWTEVPAMGAVEAMGRYYQVRVRMGRDRFPYRPGVAALTVVFLEA